MKTRTILLTAILLTVLTTSSRCINNREVITGSKNYITRDYKVADFDKLNLGTVADVYYTQSADDSWTLQVYGPDNIVELVNVDVKDNTLIVNMKKKGVKKANLKINISSPNLQHVRTHGVGNFNIKEKFETTNFTLRNEGVGGIKINDIMCTDLDIRSEGVGNVSIKGQAEKASLITQGVGNIDADELKSDTVVATADGVGSISCYAKQSINAKVNGVGSISYKGNPADKQVRKNGIGSIKQK
ncbi:head GIN domain-containing protein [Bacteroides sp. 51]|uniref:head GIN domain-containing protein n=1 Tax=Bacteroides sp. 51 TaxID=2302938 RepID=UPI0013D45FB7|nr:head GIN domain-containing protein [Bacteroides sp. 51]NDV80454.1 DUF2807 domain-containing protein [Bacteroides sp. 51]